jgi:hypothetical protein
MKSILFFSLLAISNFTSLDIIAQTHTSEQNHTFKKNRISVLWGNTIVPAAKTADDEMSVVIFPSWGLNYEYWFNNHFALGIQNEFEMQSYVVEHDSHPSLEREYPIITSIVLFYEPLNHLAFFAGPGIEIEKNHNFYIFKAGIEYIIPLPKNFDIALEGSYESKNNMYDAWTFGLCIGKRFGNSSKH